MEWSWVVVSDNTPIHDYQPWAPPLNSHLRHYYRVVCGPFIAGEGTHTAVQPTRTTSRAADITNPRTKWDGGKLGSQRSKVHQQEEHGVQPPICTCGSLRGQEGSHKSCCERTVRSDLDTNSLAILLPPVLGVDHRIG